MRLPAPHPDTAVDRSRASRSRVLSLIGARDVRLNVLPGRTHEDGTGVVGKGFSKTRLGRREEGMRKIDAKQLGVKILGPTRFRVQCLECGKTWSIIQPPGGRPRRGWHKCPKGCNVALLRERRARQRRSKAKRKGTKRGR